MNEVEYRLSLQIDVTVLEVWIEQGWVLPQTTERGRQFRDIDVARGRLILDLIDTMGVNSSGVDVAIDLLDQLHGLRGALRALMTAINTQEDEVQRRILAEVDRVSGDAA